VEKVFQTDVAIHLAPHPIGDIVDDLRTVLRWIDVDPERALAERQIDDPDNLSGDFGRVRVDGLKCGKTFQRLGGNAGIGTGFVFGDPRLIRRLAGVSAARWIKKSGKRLSERA
jgi:hypothetical protein